MTGTSAFALAWRLRAGETVYGAWCMTNSPIVAETIAREGFAAVVLDAQHGLWDDFDGNARRFFGINLLNSSNFCRC